MLALLGALTALVIAAVVFRKVGAALVWYDEVASVLLAWLTYYGAALAALHHGHIGFPKAVEYLGPRVQRAVAIVREIVVVGFFAIAGWAGWKVLVVLEGDYLVSVPWIPAQLTQSVIPIGAALFIAAELLSLGQQPRDPS